MAILKHRFPELDSALKEGRTVELLHADLLQNELRGATVVWMGSLAFPQNLMAKIAERLLDHASVGCRVVTMLEFPPPTTKRKLKMVRRQVLSVSVRWSHAKGAKAYMYEI